MAKRAQIASLAISRGGGKKTIFTTGGTSESKKYSPEEKEKEKEDGDEDGRERVRARLTEWRERERKRHGRQEQMGRSEIERLEEEGKGMGE